MNEWLYRNSMVEYEQRLESIDNERRTRKLSAHQPFTKVVSTVIADITKLYSAHSQHGNQTPIRLQPRS